MVVAAAVAVAGQHALRSSVPAASEGDILRRMCYTGGFRRHGAGVEFRDVFWPRVDISLDTVMLDSL